MERGTPPPEKPETGRPEAPAAPQPPPQAPPAPAPGYGGPVPPGGWQQPIERPTGWEGRPLASWGSRFGAWIIDLLVLLIPAIILFVLIVGGAVGLTGDEDSASWWAIVGSLVLWGLVMGVVGLLYAPLLMQRDGEHNGQTWGKQALGIRVIRDTGEPMGFAWAALREIVVKQLAVGIASAIIPVLPWLLNYLWPLWDDQNRALHDMAVQTHVVRAN